MDKVYPMIDFAAALMAAMDVRTEVVTPGGRTLQIRSRTWRGTDVHDGDGRLIGELHTDYVAWSGALKPARVRSVHFGWSEHPTQVECLAYFVRMYDLCMECEEASSIAVDNVTANH